MEKENVKKCDGCPYTRDRCDPDDGQDQLVLKKKLDISVRLDAQEDTLFATIIVCLMAPGSCPPFTSPVMFWESPENVSLAPLSI